MMTVGYHPPLRYAALSGLSLRLCTLGWALVGKTSYEDLSEFGKTKHSYLFSLFALGILLFNVLLAMSGWMRSRKLGMVTTAFGVFAFISLMFLFKGSLV
jgi:hypothetical protein